MENFVAKFQGSSKDEINSIETSSNPEKDGGARKMSSYDQDKIQGETNKDESDFSEVSNDIEEKETSNEDPSQYLAEERSHGIK